MPQIDVDQAVFWNAAAAGSWPGTPEGFLERLLMWESAAGRVRDPLRPKGPRRIDLDLLVFGSEIRRSRRLSLPHPGLVHRRFALEPLLEVWPEALDPESGLPWSRKLQDLPDQGVDRVTGTW